MRKAKFGSNSKHCLTQKEEGEDRKGRAAQGAVAERNSIMVQDKKWDMLGEVVYRLSTYVAAGQIQSLVRPWVAYFPI